ncbi:MAG: DUF721 domain-containing protein [Desulfopila sp.]
MKRNNAPPGAGPLGALLPAILEDRGWQDQIELHAIFLHWSSVVDVSVSDHAEPLKIVRGTLWLTVENSSWLQQLQYQKVALLESINAFLQGPRIDNIRLVLPQPEQRVKRVAPKVRFQAPAPQMVQQFEEMVAAIDDEPSRQALVRFWYLAKACVREEQG